MNMAPLTYTPMRLIWLVMAILALQAYPQGRNFREVTVTGHKPLKEIGLQRSVLDSMALKENIAMSIADVLAYNSSIFVKNAGRATLSTVAFRGTSASHTQVTWNGLKINSPMLGMTDFSTIPSYFIDNASLLHGASSVNETGGGLGGAIRLESAPDVPSGFNMQYIQGIGSFRTFDEFAGISYKNDHWTTSTRAVYSSSVNDYTYTNHDKKLNIYDENNNITGQYHPREHNRNGAYHDMHLLQDITYNTLRGDRISLNVWYLDSHRELPLLTTDYTDDTRYENLQREHTVRAIMNWTHTRSRWKTNVNAGYIHTGMAYNYSRATTADRPMTPMTQSHSRVNTFHGYADGEYMPNRQWLFTASLSADQNLVLSHDKNISGQDGSDRLVGYDVGQLDASGALSAKWRPVNRFGMSVTLRKEVHGHEWAPLIPALFLESIISESAGLEAKASITRNYRAPSLNDLYFMPGGNPELNSESRGLTHILTTG